MFDHLWSIISRDQPTGHTFCWGWYTVTMHETLPCKATRTIADIEYPTEDDDREINKDEAAETDNAAEMDDAGSVVSSNF